MRKVIWILCVLMLMMASTCFASIASSSVCVGGIHPGMGMDEVISLHGTPLDQDGRNYYYDSTTIYVDSRDHVIGVHTSSSDFPTTMGVVSGMSASVLSDVYGRADTINQSDGYTVYAYYGNHVRMEFGVVDGYIQYIDIRG